MTVLTVTGGGGLAVTLVAHVTTVIFSVALEGAVDTLAVGAVEVSCEIHPQVITL